MIYLHLFYEFFKIGLFAVGGGLATLPFLYELAETRGWITVNDIADMIAISEATPGPLGINMATYVGYSTRGVLGGIIAMLGIITPSIVIILIIATFIQKFKNNKTVQNIFYGLRPTATALIAAAGFEVLKMVVFHHTNWNGWTDFMQSVRWDSLVLGGVLAILVFRVKWHPVFYILISAFIGIVLRLEEGNIH